MATYLANRYDVCNGNIHNSKSNVCNNKSDAHNNNTHRREEVSSLEACRVGGRAKESDRVFDSIPVGYIKMTALLSHAPGFREQTPK